MSGEHTGNLGVVDTRSRRLRQVLAISRPIPGCVPPPPEPAKPPRRGKPPAPGKPPEAAEPHGHGVGVLATGGTVYVSDEGEDCFHEAATLLEP